MFADENGMTVAGWPEIIARTVQFEKMILLDYTFLDNPEGNDLPFDIMTVVWWIANPFISSMLTSFLQSYGLDVGWAIAAGYIAYYQF